jgi:ubiquinone/menaquinone biosynthesis C-methylase UbiE
MSHKAGEETWWDKFTPEQKAEEMRKPWLHHSGPGMLAEAGAIIALLPPPPAIVLDCGCAGGHLTNILELCGYMTIGIDVCGDAYDGTLTEGVKWNKIIALPHFNRCDFDQLHDNFREDTIDAVVFASALHHSTDQKQTLWSAYRVLKPGGILIASEPGVFHGSSKHSREWAEKMDVTEKSTPPYRIAKLAKKVGFASVKVYPNPVTLFKAAYQTKALGNHPVVQTLVGLPLGVAAVAAAKWLHGLIVLIK